MLSVCLYYHSLSGECGGAERQIIWCANRLYRHGLGVILLTLDELDASCYYDLDKNIGWKKVQTKPGMFGKIRKTYSIYRELRKNNINVLVGYVIAGDKTITAACKFAGVRIISAERNSPDIYFRKYSSYQRYTCYFNLWLADQVVVQLPEFVSDYPKFLQKKILTIQNWLDRPAAEKSHNIVESNRTMLFVGRLDLEQKRVDLIIRAFGRLCESTPNWKLRVVGSGPGLKKLHDLVDALNLRELIDFNPSTRDLGPIYRSADIFVIASAWEGFPNALIEAMSYGLPAIGFRDTKGVNSLIQDGYSGWLAADVDSEVGLLNAMLSAVESDSEIISRGAAARSFASTFYQGDPTEKWIDLIRSLSKPNDP